MELSTPSLTLVSFTPAQLLGIIDGTGSLEEHLGRAAADGLREFFISADVAPRWVAMLRESPTPDHWKHGFAVVHRGADKVIGTAGFKGVPDGEGVVEIGYGIVESERCRGYATEAAAALVNYAAASGQVGRVCAHTLAAESPSTRVLTKCGFRQTGEVVDPDDGLVWRWERSVAP